jgi:hypothetical protein
VSRARQDALKARALSAWYRTGGKDQPSAVTLRTHEGQPYLVVRGKPGILAVYRVREVTTQAGMLRRMKRWPVEIEK